MTFRIAWSSRSSSRSRPRSNAQRASGSSGTACIWSSVHFQLPWSTAWRSDRVPRKYRLITSPGHKCSTNRSAPAAARKPYLEEESPKTTHPAHSTVRSLIPSSGAIYPSINGSVYPSGIGRDLIIARNRTSDRGSSRPISHQRGRREGTQEWAWRVCCRAACGYNGLGSVEVHAHLVVAAVFKTVGP